MAHFTQPRDCFYSPETQQWAVHGQPTCPISVSLFGTEFLTNFLSYKHPSIISHTHNSPLQFLEVHGCPKILKQFHNFGPKFWDRSNGPSRPQTNRNMEKHLKNGNNTSREKPLPLGVCQNSQIRGPCVACSA